MDEQQRLVVFSKELDGQMGLDLCILDDEATAADLVAALAPMSEDPCVHKRYHPQRRGSCCGCKDNCCTHSLIVPDLRNLSNLAHARGLSLAALVDQCCDHEALSRGFVLFRSFPCLFLEDDRCTIYPYRPLICRLFICTQITDDFQELIFRILGRGISDLHRVLAGELIGPPSGSLPELGGSREVDYREEFTRFYHRALKQPLPLAGEPGDFHTWKLRDLCDDEMWRVLTRS